jgi:hypothetical protein
VARKNTRSKDAVEDEVTRDILKLNERISDVVVRLEALRVALQTRHGLSPEYYEEIEKIVRQAFDRRYKTSLKAFADRRTDEQFRELLDDLEGRTQH